MRNVLICVSLYIFCRIDLELEMQMHTYKHSATLNEEATIVSLLQEQHLVF